MKKISSGQTFFIKRVFPYLWVFVGGVACLIAFRIGVFNFELSEPILAFVVMWSLSSLAFFWLASVLKEVSIDSNALYVSFNREEIRVPFSKIAYVGESFFIGPKIVTVVLRSPAAFGHKIRFLPQDILLDTFRKHPIVKELNRHVTHDNQ